MEAISTVVGKVAVMLLLIIVGYIITKKGMLTEKGAAEITSLLIKIVTPCLIINSLISAGKDLELNSLLLAAVVSALSMGIGILVSLLFFKKEPMERRKVLRFSVIFSNAGFMGLPLIQGIVGDTGVVYGSFFVVVFNLICWTYGYAMMSGGGLNQKTALLNPGIIGLAVGLPVYFLRLELPAVIREPIGFLSDLNTPLAMLIIGSHVARVNLKSFLADRSVYLMAFLRLILCPALYLALLLLIRPGQELFVSSVIQASTPVAANTVLFAVEYHQDSQLASKTVAFTTMLSILTIPVFTILAQLACGF